MMDFQCLKEAVRDGAAAYARAVKGTPSPSVATEAIMRVRPVFERIMNGEWPITAAPDLEWMRVTLQDTYFNMFDVDFRGLEVVRIKDYQLKMEPVPSMRADVKKIIDAALSHHCCMAISDALMAAPSPLRHIANTRASVVDEDAFEAAYEPVATLLAQPVFQGSLDMTLCRSLGSIGPLATRAVLTAIDEVSRRAVGGDANSTRRAVHFLDSLQCTFILYPHDRKAHTYVVVGS